MTNLTCLTEQDLTLLYYGEDPVSMSLLEAHRHIKRCPTCQQRQLQLEREMRAFPQDRCELDPHYATRLAARVVERVPRRRFALPAVAGGIATAVVVFSFTFWQPETVTVTVTHNAAVHPSVVTEETPSPDVDLLENLELLRELDMLSELTGV